MFAHSVLAVVFSSRAFNTLSRARLGPPMCFRALLPKWVRGLPTCSQMQWVFYVQSPLPRYFKALVVPPPLPLLVWGGRRQHDPACTALLPAACHRGTAPGMGGGGIQLFLV